MAYRVRRSDRHILRGVSFRIGRGESFGLVGESGCGKSTVALAIVRYLARNGRVTAGRISVAGRDLLALGKEELRQLRATTVAMVYQDPGRALNPSLRTGTQLAEVFALRGLARREAYERAAAMLGRGRVAPPGAGDGREPPPFA